MKRPSRWFVSIGVLAICVTAIAFNRQIESARSASADSHPLTIALDCSPAVGVQTNCVFPSGTTSVPIDVVVTNHGAAFELGAMSAEMLAFDAVGLTPGVPFLHPSIAAPNWLCGPPPPVADANLDSNPLTVEPQAGCYTISAFPVVPSSATIRLFTMTYTTSVDAAYTLTFDFADVYRMPEFESVARCGIVLAGGDTADCPITIVQIGDVPPPTSTTTPTPVHTHTPTLTPTPTPTRTPTPTWTSTPTPTDTPTRTPTPTGTLSPTATPTVTPTGCNGDADCDGFLDPQQTLHLGPINFDASRDNCPSNVNPTQENADGNWFDHPVPIIQNDKSWARSDNMGDECDPDDDNDGISDADELSGTACTGKITDPLRQDSDGDRFLDGAECSLGTDPTDTVSKPTPASCGPTGDLDGDRIANRVEVCHYNTDPSKVDTDGDKPFDGANDGCEIGSFNGDRLVNIADSGMLGAAIGNTALRNRNIDVNKDGVFNPADQGIVATLRMGACVL